MPRRNLHRKRKILLDLSKRISNTANTEIPATSSAFMQTPELTSVSTLDQIHLTSLKPARRIRTRGRSEASGSHSRLEVTTGQTVNVPTSPSIPSTPSLSASKSYTGSSLTPSSSGLTGYPPSVAQRQTGLAYNPDFSTGLDRAPMPFPGDSFFGQGTPSSSLDRDILAQHSLRPQRPPDMCALIATEYGAVLVAKNDMTVPHCAIFSSAVNRHRFHASLRPPLPGVAYITPVGYIPNPRSCLILRLKTEEVEIEISLAVIDKDDSSPDADIYLGRDFWNKLHSGRFGPPRGFNGLHSRLGSTLQPQDMTSYARPPASSEAWRATDYRQGAHMIGVEPPGAGFQNAAVTPNCGSGMGIYSPVSLNSVDPEGSEAVVGLSTVRDSMLSQHSPYVRPYEMPGIGNYSTLGQASATGQYSYDLSTGNMLPHGFESFATSGYDVGQGGIQPPHWNPSVGPGTESCQ